MPPVEIFYQFFGFLLQTLPIAVLSFVPFGDDALIWHRKKLMIVFSAGTALLSAGFTVMSLVMFEPAGEYDVLLQVSSNLYMTACIILWSAAFCLTIRSQPVKKLMVLILMVFYAAVLFIVNNIIAGFITDSQAAAAIYDKYTLIISIVLLAVTFSPVYLFLKREVRFALSYMENQTIQRSCNYLMLAMLSFFICIFSLSTFNFYYSFSNTSVILFLSAFMFTDFMLCFILFSEARLAAQTRQLEEQLRSFDNQYRQISASIDEARRTRHDIRHHLNQISTLNHRGEQKALEEYLESYGASFKELEEMNLCNYPAFDNILQYYIEMADRQGIDVRTQLYPLRESLGFDVIDLTVMLGNLMENAIEACCKLPAGNLRLIRIWVKQSDAAFLIEIDNSCLNTGSEQPDFSDGACFISTKHVGKRGQGLKSIRFAAEKYGGSAEFKKSNGIFTARVVMNIP